MNYYNDKTTDNIQDELLSNVSNDYEKTVGYPLYDTLKAVAIEIAKVYKNMDDIVSMMDVDNLVGTDLEKYVYQRKGITKDLGSYAKTTLTVNGQGTVYMGNIFETKTGIQFAALNDTNINGSGIVLVQCLEIGSIGMVEANTIVQIPVTIKGIVSCTNPNPTEDGYDEESNDSLRQKYYEAIRKPAFSGNRYHYIKWAKDISGVGENVEVFPLWNGPNTVKVIIIDTNGNPASDSLIEKVQNYIDPKGTLDTSTGKWSTWGTGIGEAPMGAYCTVCTATIKTINIAAAIKKAENYTDDDIKSNITKGISNYFKSIALDEKNNYVSFAKIININLSTDGVNDCNTLAINGGNLNIPISLTAALCEIPAVGEVSISDA